MIFAYAAKDEEIGADILAFINDYARSKNIALSQTLIDEGVQKLHWHKRKIDELLTKTMSQGDELVVYEASQLARSTLQVLEILEAAAAAGVTVHFVKYDMIYSPESTIKTAVFLQLMQSIESDFVARRTTDALARRRAAGLPLGRPKGRKNKSRKLDKYSADIKRYLALNISKASIAKLVGCHAQTLYSYIEDKGLEDDAYSETTAMQGGESHL